MKKVVTLSLDDDTVRMLEQISEKINMSKSEFVREAILYFVTVDASSLLMVSDVPVSRLRVNR